MIIARRPRYRATDTFVCDNTDCIACGQLYLGIPPKGLCRSCHKPMCFYCVKCKSQAHQNGGARHRRSKQHKIMQVVNREPDLDVVEFPDSEADSVEPELSANTSTDSVMITEFEPDVDLDSFFDLGSELGKASPDSDAASEDFNPDDYLN